MVAGLSVPTARTLCEQESGTRSLTADWTGQLMKEAVAADKITLLAVGKADATGQEVVITCVVSGTETTPALETYTLQ